MYICNECGAVFDEPAVEREVHFWIDGSPLEEFSVCPECGDTDFTEAFECDGCGECDEREYIEYDNSDWEHDHRRDEEYFRYMEKEKC